MSEAEKHAPIRVGAGHDGVAGGLLAVGRTNDQLDTRELRRAFGRFATGVAIATTAGADGPVGLTINSFSSVSLEPPLVLWSLRKDASTVRDFLASEHYAINVLSVSQRALANRFASKEANKFHGVEASPGRTGAPLLRGCLAHFECRLTEAISCGDHHILLGEVEHAWHREDQPLLFSSGAYGVAASMPC